MQKIKTRDFQRHFCQLYKEGVPYQVLDPEGVSVGIWLPPTMGPQSIDTIRYEGKAGDTVSSQQTELVAETSKVMCGKCYRAEPMYRVEDKLLDDSPFQMDVCGWCFRAFKFKKIKRLA